MESLKIKSGQMSSAVKKDWKAGSSNKPLVDKSRFDNVKLSNIRRGIGNPSTKQGTEDNRKSKLAQARNISENLKLAAGLASPNAVTKAKSAIAISMKLSKHKGILGIAIIFDLIGLIPFLNIVTNWVFAMILYMKFGSKRKKAGSQSEMMGIVLPMVIGTALDSVLSVVPACLSAAIVRIVLNNK